MRMPPKEMDSHSYHQKYLNLKKKFKALLYENESFQEELRKSQRKLLKISRDKSFLLDRLLKYENVESSTSDSDITLSSDTEGEVPSQIIMRKSLPKSAPVKNGKNISAPTKNGKNVIRKKAHSVDLPEPFPSSASMNNATNEVKKKKPRKAAPPKAAAASVADTSKRTSVKIEPLSIGLGDGHMTSEEIERHLEAKQSLRDLMPEKTPLTLPIEIFSNDPSEMEIM